MDSLIILAFGLATGAAATWLLQRTEIKYLRDELKVAHAQIAHAVLSEGAQIPMRVEEPEPMKPLPAELGEVVHDWEDPESRIIEEAKIRHQLAEGYGVNAILRQYRANP